LRKNYDINKKTITGITLHSKNAPKDNQILLTLLYQIITLHSKNAPKDNASKYDIG
jgi:hypothetical protein